MRHEACHAPISIEKGMDPQDAVVAGGHADDLLMTRLPRPDWQDDPGRGGMRRSATPALDRLLKQACGRFSDGEQKARLLLA
jgi:hypothetical protein